MNLGKVAFTLRGLYNENEAYEKLDVIYHGGSSYVVVTPFSGIEPSPESEHVILIAERGEKGDPFTFEELTEEQKQELKGDPGNGFVIRGYYENLLNLEALVTKPQAGDVYGVGEEHPYEIYVFDAVNGVWRNYGRLEGPQGARGTDEKSAYEIAVDHGFEGSEEAWLQQQVRNGKNAGTVTIQAPAVTLESDEDIHLQSGGKVLYNQEEIAVRSNLDQLVSKEALQEKMDQLGAVTYIVLITDNYDEIEAIEHLRPGAIALVKEEEPTEQNNYKEYIWLSEENGWEYLGMVSAQDIDMENYYDKEAVDQKLTGKVSLTGDETISGVKTFSSILKANAGIQWEGIVLEENTDLNNIVTPGIYKQGASATVVTFLNCPTTQAFSMVVLKSAFVNGIGAQQIIFTYNPAMASIANKTIWWRNIYNSDYGPWHRMAFAQETPQFGKYQTATPFAITLDSIYDIRLSSSASSGTLSFSSSAVDGMKYKLSVINIGSSDLVITLPTGTSYQSDDTTWTIEAGKVGILGIVYVYGKYIMTVIA